MYALERQAGRYALVEYFEQDSRLVLAEVTEKDYDAALRLVRLGNIAAAAGFTDEELEMLAENPEVVSEVFRRRRLLEERCDGPTPR